MNERLDRLVEWLKLGQASGILISNRSNIFYFSGFTGSNGALVVNSAGEKKLITDFRYLTQAEDESPGWDLLPQSKTIYETSMEFILANKGKWLFEDEYMSVKEFEELPKDSSIIYSGCSLSFFREIKNDFEIQLIKKAARIADASFESLINWIEPGKSEKEVQRFLDYQMIERGASQTSFSTIVASGPNSALPHATPSDRKLTKGDLVVIDFGAKYNGYCSDETRTISVGQASEKQKMIYQLVLDAQLASLRQIKEGAINKEVDFVARDIISKAGFGDYFGHGLGHSLGIDIHENPRLSPQAPLQSLKSGMVVTVEPGIYIPRVGGVRIEDLVVVKSEGCEIVSATSKELIEI